jgi:hypothetical protein
MINKEDKKWYDEYRKKVLKLDDNQVTSHYDVKKLPIKKKK